MGSQGKGAPVATTPKVLAHPQQLLGEVASLINATIHGDKALGRGLVTHIVVVQARVEHDDGEREHVTGVCKSGKGLSSGGGLWAWAGLGGASQGTGLAKGWDCGWVTQVICGWS